MIRKDLLFNLILLLLATIIVILIEIFVLNKSRNKNFIIGVISGIISVLSMSYPYVYQEGLIFDGRSIILSLVYLFYGSISGNIAGKYCIYL